jgi:hypothetical protein
MPAQMRKLWRVNQALPVKRRYSGILVDSVACDPYIFNV